MVPSLRKLVASLLLAGLSFGLTAAPAAAQYWQCAPYARSVSGIQLFGNASGWWSQAAGKYARGTAPRAGAVLAFKAASNMRAGHVAMVSQVIDARTVRVTHANWSVINGSRGKVERDVTVIDVSDANDWSRVKVWWAPTQSVGTSAYATYGFIYGDGPAGDDAAQPAPRLDYNKGVITLASLAR